MNIPTNPIFPSVTDPDDQRDIEIERSMPASAVKSRPILFSSEMVRAILDGRKTQTRRVVKRQPIGVVSGPDYDGLFCETKDPVARYFACPYGQPGDHLWVRETFAVMQGVGAKYRADNPGAVKPSEYWDTPWTPSIFMQRTWSRITLEIVGIRVERLQEITAKDAIAEGIEVDNSQLRETPNFRELWDSLNGKKHPWSRSPWVWVIEFRRIKP